MTKRLLIFGAGTPDILKIVHSINQKGEDHLEIEAFVDVDDDTISNGFFGYPVLDERTLAADKYHDCWVVNYIGASMSLRRKVQSNIERLGFTNFATLVAGDVDPYRVTIGDGSIIYTGCQIGPETEIGSQCLILMGANLNHECILGDYVFLGPNCTVLGRVEIGDGAYIGGGAILLPNVRIGEGSVIGAGAVVTKDIPPGMIAAGVPARAIKRKQA